jgi:hypothetical protein
MSRKSLPSLVLRFTLVASIAVVALPGASTAADLTASLQSPGVMSTPSLLASAWSAALVRLGLASTSSTPAPGTASAAAPISPSRGFGLDPDGIHPFAFSVAPASPARARRPQPSPSAPVLRRR